LTAVGHVGEAGGVAEEGERAIGCVAEADSVAEKRSRPNKGFADGSSIFSAVIGMSHNTVRTKTRPSTKSGAMLRQKKRRNMRTKAAQRVFAHGRDRGLC
jgi:hypothetical protein